MKLEIYDKVNVSLDIEAQAVDPQLQACLRLWAAKLILHLRDYEDSLRNGADFDYSTSKASSRYYIAHSWISDDADHIGSFVWTCGLFNIDPEYARRAIKKKVTSKERKREA